MPCMSNFCFTELLPFPSCRSSYRAVLYTLLLVNDITRFNVPIVIFKWEYLIQGIGVAPKPPPQSMEYTDP